MAPTTPQSPSVRPMSPKNKYDNIPELRSIVTLDRTKTSISSPRTGGRYIDSDADKQRKIQFYRDAVLNIRVYLSIIKDALKGVFKAQKEVYSKSLRRTDIIKFSYQDKNGNSDTVQISPVDIKAAFNNILVQIGSFTYIMAYAKKGNHSSTPESFKGVYSPVYVHQALAEFMLNCALPYVIPSQLQKGKPFNYLLDSTLVQIQAKFDDALSLIENEAERKMFLDNFDGLYPNTAENIMDVSLTNILGAPGPLLDNSICIRNLATSIFHLHAREMQTRKTPMKGVSIFKKGVEVDAHDHARFSDDMLTYFNGNIKAFYNQESTGEKVPKKSVRYPDRMVMKMKKVINSTNLNTLEVLQEVQNKRVAAKELTKDSFSLTEDDFNIYFFNNMASANYSSKRDINELWKSTSGKFSPAFGQEVLSSFEDPLLKAGMLYQHNVCYLVGKILNAIEDQTKKMTGK